MIVMVVVTVVLLAVVAVCAWPALEDWKATDTESPGNDAATATAAAKPETLEGVLVRQLLSQEISRQQYLHAIERLAERDADRHPLSVPPNE